MSHALHRGSLVRGSAGAPSAITHAEILRYSRGQKRLETGDTRVVQGLAIWLHLDRDTPVLVLTGELDLLTVCQDPWP